MKVAVIAAVADNGIIGRENGLPWHISADLRRFKRLTMGHHLIMGRKTFESLRRALPGRTTIVISRGRPDLPPGVLLAGSLEEALEMARRGNDDEAVVAGGGEIYRLALPLADRLYLTRVRGEIEGDVRFPNFDPSDWRLICEEEHLGDDSSSLSYSFQEFERVLAT